LSRPSTEAFTSTNFGTQGDASAARGAWPWPAASRHRRTFTMSSALRPFGGDGPRRLLRDRVSAHADEACAVYIGDAADVLHDLPASAVDAVVTDPPAGMRFRGMHWDTFRPARTRGGAVEQVDPARQAFIDFLNPVMRECRRALKPGGHALAWAIPRTSHWTATAIEDAGFEVRDVITHHFGTGFPK